MFRIDIIGSEVYPNAELVDIWRENEDGKKCWNQLLFLQMASERSSGDSSSSGEQKSEDKKEEKQ